MRRNLTDVFLRSLKPPPAGRLEVQDTQQRGLLLRVGPAGATWYVRIKASREMQQRRVRIGTYPEMTLSAARHRTVEVIADIQRGTEPLAEKRPVEARPALPTVAARLAEWQQARRGDWSHRHAAETRRLANREIVPRLGARALVETTRADWTAIVESRRAEAPALASALYGLCSAFTNYAEARGWLAVPMLPRRGHHMLAPPPASRSRVLSDSELLAVWQASERLAPKPRCYIRLLVLTAARSSEAADIAVGEIDRAAGLWTVPGSRSKNGLPITLPLHPLALEALEEVWPGHAAGPSWRLLGSVAGSGLRNTAQPKARLDQLSGVRGWRLHDIRRTARTGLTKLGVSRDHAEACLNHVSSRSAMERVYDRHDFGPEVIAAMSRWQAHVAGLIGEAPVSEVVPIRRAG